MKKKVMLGLLSSFLLAGLIGCSNTNNQGSDKKTNVNQSGKNSMNMTDEQMKNMKSSDNK